jgi:alpha-1,2-glucosyltransferase
MDLGLTGMTRSPHLQDCTLHRLSLPFVRLTEGRYLFDRAIWWAKKDCSTYNLRIDNAIAILCLALVVSVCRHAIERQQGKLRSGKADSQDMSVYALHTAFNITLFPVLFFFSALYYTDVVSTLSVLVAYRNHLHRLTEGRKWLFFNDTFTVLLGVASMLMRQTNIFWVVVYMGGVEAMHAVEQLKPAAETLPQSTTVVEVVRRYGRRYAIGDVHDPPLSYAWLEGMSLRFRLT